MTNVSDMVDGSLLRGELLLELLSEEIPARMQRRAIGDLCALVRDKLAAAEIPAATLRGYVTPRRLTVIADGIPERQPDRSEERRGPRVGAPQQALDGFLRASGIESIGQCEIRDTGRGEFYFAIIERPGRAAAEVLPELLHAAIAELPWPKSMRSPAAALRWVRPLVSVICLFDGQIVPLSLDEVPVGRTTRGHRFLSEGEISVENAADYLDKIEAAHVILDHDRRRAMIAADLDRLAAAEGLKAKPDPGLLDEVAGLVEFPVVLIGAIDAQFVRRLPAEVLATAMRTHQKYFTCLNPDGRPASRFLFVANNLTADCGKTIVAGNERVLRARLADARFFWEQDRKMPLAVRVEALKQRIYYDKLGTMYDKTERMERLAENLAERLGADIRTSRQAAHLAKADLSTGMVGEFPELQGVMGRYYAHPDQGPEIADAVGEHYKPLGPNDTCPITLEGAIVALADKLDTLAAFFAIDERPTGSSDPFALRRAALGIVRIVLERDLRGPLVEWIGHAMNGVAGYFRNHDLPYMLQERRREEIYQQVRVFMSERLRVHLRDQGIPPDVIAAVVKPGFDRGESDLVLLVARIRALRSFLATEEGENLSITYRRASSILSIEERRDKASYVGQIDHRLLQLSEEEALAKRLAEIGARVGGALSREDFELAMAELASLRQPLDAFFDKVTVNVDERALRANRLRLLSQIRRTMDRVADFSQIEG